MIDDPIGIFDNFPNLIQRILWYNVSRKRRIGNLLGAARDAVNHAQCIFGRVLRDISKNCIKMILRGVGPVNGHAVNFLQTGL